MSIAADLLKSEHIGIRNLKEHLSGELKKKKPLIVTDRGVPVNVILPYLDMMELIDIIDELSDEKTLKAVQEGRKVIQSGAKGTSVSNLFKKIRSKRK